VLIPELTKQLMVCLLYLMTNLLEIPASIAMKLVTTEIQKDTLKHGSIWKAIAIIIVHHNTLSQELIPLPVTFISLLRHMVILSFHLHAPQVHTLMGLLSIIQLYMFKYTKEVPYRPTSIM